MPIRVVPGLALAFALAVSGCSSASTGSAGAAPRSVPPAQGGTVSGGSTSTASTPCGWSSKPAYRHVVWIWMENRTYESVLGPNGDATNLSRYARRCGVATNYQAITHPSLPNYVAAVAGSTLGISTDCAPADCPARAKSLYAQVAGHGKRWMGYAEAMNQRCDRASYGRYAARHNPAVYFPGLRTQCLRHDVPLGGSHGRFARALSANRLPAFAFVTPNLCHDGHDCSTSVADTWLGGMLDRITGSKAYAAGHTVVFVTWDEGVGSDNRVASVVIGPTVTPGTRSARAFNHYSLLRTTEQILGLPFLRAAANARSMRTPFHL